MRNPLELRNSIIIFHDKTLWALDLTSLKKPLAEKNFVFFLRTKQRFVREIFFIKKKFSLAEKNFVFFLRTKQRFVREIFFIKKNFL